MRTQANPADRQAADADLDAFNAAFDEIGFEWHWDRATMAELAAVDDDRGRVRTYVERHHPHLLKVYDAEFLCDLVVGLKERASGGNRDGRRADAAMQQKTFA
jgi:hypothetical protein